MIKAIALTMGYVESAACSWLIYQCEHGKPKTKIEAFGSLTLYLYRKYLIDMQKYVKYDTCCKKEQWENKEAVFCSKCGTKLREEFTPELFQEFLVGLAQSDSNDYGDHEDAFDKNDPIEWSPWQFEFDCSRDEMIVVKEQAELMIAIMLSRLKPELFVGEWADFGKESQGAADWTGDLDRLLQD